MEIIRAGLENLPVVVGMKMRMFREVGSDVLLQDNAQEKILRTYAELYREDKCCHFIAYDDSEAVACGGAVIKEDVPFCFFRNPRYGYVIDVYCVPEKRRLGYATKIVEAVLGWLREKNAGIVRLKPSLAARGLYERLGFRDSGEMEMPL